MGRLAFPTQLGIGPVNEFPVKYLTKTIKKKKNIGRVNCSSIN